MTNGEQLYKSNMYDILCRIQDAANPEDHFCVIDAISGKEQHTCIITEIGLSLELDCKRCIEHWLNKEEANWK